MAFWPWMSSPGSPGVGPDTGSDPGSALALWPWFSGFDVEVLSFTSGFGSLGIGAASDVCGWNGCAVGLSGQCFFAGTGLLVDSL